MKKTCLTLQDHWEIGATLKNMHHSLLHLRSAFRSSYHEKQFPLRSINEALDNVQKIRALAEMRLFLEYPTEASQEIYFGSLDQNEKFKRE